MAGSARGVVVGAAVLAGPAGDQRLLATERASPPALAGLWEFPGGKVEAVETDHEALRRECREELGLDLEIGEQVGADVLTDDGTLTLRVYVARVTGGSLRLTEHSAYRWLAADELEEVPWISADRPVVEAVRALMTPGSR